MPGQRVADPRSWRAPTRRRPAALALVSLLCVLAQAGALLHMVLVRHQTCAEHGELVHARAVTGSPAGRETAGPSVAPVDEPASDGDADHCLLFAVARAQGAAAPDPVVGAVPRPTTRSWPPAAPPAPRVHERLRLAPKTSPPSTCV
jgi:hypothetical protein